MLSPTPRRCSKGSPAGANINNWAGLGLMDRYAGGVLCSRLPVFEPRLRVEEDRLCPCQHDERVRVCVCQLCCMHGLKRAVNTFVGCPDVGTCAL